METGGETAQRMQDGRGGKGAQQDHRRPAMAAAMGPKHSDRWKGGARGPFSW